MADRWSVRDAVSVDLNALFDEQTVATVTNSTTSVTIDKKYKFIYVQSNQDIYYTWTTSSTDAINTSNSLYLMGGDDVYILRVPWGKAADRLADLFFQMQRKTANNATVRHVLA